MLMVTQDKYGIILGMGISFKKNKYNLLITCVSTEMQDLRLAIQAKSQIRVLQVLRPVFLLLEFFFHQAYKILFL